MGILTIKSVVRKVLAVWGCVLGILLSNVGHADYIYIDHTENFDFSMVTPGHELGCLALNIYHEGRGEDRKGQAAIAAVTMNRVQSKNYPDTVCEVVWQDKQFSWTHIASRHHSVVNLRAWQQSLTLARLFLDGEEMAEIGDATHYHATTVQPYWASKHKLVAKVGNHYFYDL